MELSDSLVINDVNLSFTINSQGECHFYKNFGVDLDIFVVLKSIDTNLTNNLLHVAMGPEHDLWRYDWPIGIAKLDYHPGIILQFYDNKFNHIITKNYRFNNTSLNLKLRSELTDLTYPSYQTFFYDDQFKKLCNVKDGDIVYDLGANIGAFSLMCSNYDVKNIYAFEPNPAVYDHLKYNCEKYGRNVTTYKKAIYKNFEKLNFGNVEGNLTEGSVACSIINKNENLCSVDGIHLEVFCIVNNLEYPTYLKVDIEGAEYDFFEATSDDFLEKCHTIFLEFHNRDERLNKLIERLTNLNYKMYFLRDQDYVLSQNMGTIFFIK